MKQKLKKHRKKIVVIAIVLVIVIAAVVIIGKVKSGQTKKEKQEIRKENTVPRGIGKCQWCDDKESQRSGRRRGEKGKISYFL